MKHGWTPEKLHVIYNSLNTSQQRKIRDESTKEQALEVRRQIFGNENPVVICTTRLIAIRRLDLLLDSIHTLKERGRAVNLILVGDGPESQRLRKQAEQLCVPVHFEGACYDERRIAQLVMASNVTVAPGKVGLTAMHSMVYGVPVVTHGDASDQMPEWEAIIPGKTGSLFERGDVNSLAEAIRKWTESQFPDADTQAECHKIIDRFWNPEFQRQAIENAVIGLDADDLIDTRG
jgi:glycosyltransferase involved in cell wall biosynthesis